jgi:AGCS family alanine or glycine:cation symporter
MSFDQFIASIINASNVFGNLLWGWYTQAFLIAVGIYLLIGTRFYVFRKFGYILKNTFGTIFKKQENDTAGLTPVQAVLGALAGTIGMGNISGTASAIAVGGPGAVFWMWFFAFIGMVIKTSEVTLAVHYREVAPDGSSVYGGPMYYMRKALNAKVLAVLFSVGLILNCLLMADTMQLHMIVEAINSAYSVNPYIIAAVCVVLTMLATLGGLKSIGRVCEVIVPVMTLVWLGVAVAVVVGNISEVPRAISSIFVYAFSPVSAVGGFVGASVSLTIQQGAARGTGSNDAGVGVAPCMHATANVEHPFKQGMWGTTEVFFDTIVVCTLTALIILTPHGIWSNGKTGVVLTMTAIQSVLPAALTNILVTICIFGFCFSTVLAFYVYYETAVVDLFSKKVFRYVRWLYFLLPLLFAGYEDVNALYGGFANIGSGFCLLPNLVALAALGKPFFGLVKDWETGERKYDTAITDKNHCYIKMSKEYEASLKNTN